MRSVLLGAARIPRPNFCNQKRGLDRTRSNFSVNLRLFRVCSPKFLSAFFSAKILASKSPILQSKKFFFRVNLRLLGQPITFFFIHRLYCRRYLAARAVGFPFFLTLADYWFGESKKSAEGRYLREHPYERTRRDFNSFQFAVFVQIYADVLCFLSSFILQYKRLAPIFLRRTFFKLWGSHSAISGYRDYGVSLSNHIQIIQHRHSMIIYPEGITTPTGEVMIEWAHGGVAFLAEKTGLPIVPIYIQGVRRMKFWKKFILRRRRARIVFGKPIYARELFENLNSRPERQPLQIRRAKSPSCGGGFREKIESKNRNRLS